jgi:hypothetical protein
MAIAGLGLVGLEMVLVAPASAPSASVIFGSSVFGWQSMLTQALLVGGLLSIIGGGLAVHSRLAYVAGLFIGLVPVAAWMYLLATLDPVARQPLALLVVFPPLLLVIGLLEAWPAFWESPPNEIGSEGSADRPRR